MSRAQPPALIVGLLRLAAGDMADDVEGDLRECFHRWQLEVGPVRGQLRFVGEALRLSVGLLGRRAGRLARRKEEAWDSPEGGSTERNLEAKRGGMMGESKGYRGRGPEESGHNRKRRRAAPRIPVSVLDVKLALRLLIRQPGLTVTAVLALAVTMGLAITTWTIASQSLWSSLNVPGGERLVASRPVDIADGRRTWPSLAETATWRESGLLETSGTFVTGSANLGPGEALVAAGVPSAQVDVATLAMVGARPQLGRLIDDQDVTLGRSVVVISQALWADRFGGRADIIGEQIELDGVLHEIVGVASEGFHFPINQDLWVPIDGRLTADWSVPVAGMRFFGRLRPSATIDQLDQELAAFSAQLPGESDRKIRVESVPFTRSFMSPGADVLLMGIALALVALMLIAASNVANLILARTEARGGELSVRTALGASRGRIVGQLFIEVLALSLAAAVVGIWACTQLLAWLDSMVIGLPYWVTLEIGAPTAAFSIALAIVAAVVAGAFPALRATGGGMQAGLRSGRTAAFGKFSGAMIVAELALTVGLLAGAIAMGRGLIGYQGGSYGLPEEEVLTATVRFVPLAAVSDEDGLRILEQELLRLQDAIRTGLAPHRGVRQIGFSGSLPGEGSTGIQSIEIGGVQGRFNARAMRADRAFYEALDVQPTGGRLLEDPVGGSTVRQVMVNQPFVDRLLSGRNAIGRQMRYIYGSEASNWYEIVGVIPDIGMSPGDPANSPAVHSALGESNYLKVSIRTDGDPQALADPLRVAVSRFDDSAILEDVQLLSRAGWEARALLQGLGGSLLLLGLMALLLSAAGLHAVLSFAVSRRTREIGVRVALGASPSNVLRDILPTTLIQVGIGATLGVLIGFGTLEFTKVLPISVPQSPVLHLLAPAALLIAGTLAAALRPVLRALAIRPAEALRQE